MTRSFRSNEFVQNTEHLGVTLRSWKRPKSNYQPNKYPPVLVYLPSSAPKIHEQLVRILPLLPPRMDTEKFLHYIPEDATRDASTNDTSDPSSASLEGNQKCCTESRKKFILGLIISICLAVAWVGAQQFAQTAVQLATFDAPYFTTWYGTCWMILCFPGYCLFVVITQRDKTKVCKAIRDSANIFGTPRITAKQFFTRIVPMNILWLEVNYIYIFALKFIAATDASAIMASNVAFVYMLSMCVLHEKLYCIRVLACLFCISGVVLFAYAEGFKGSSQLLAGVLMATGSAFGAAVYKVVLKKILDAKASLGQVSLFLSLLGVSNLVFMWIVFLALYLSGVEHVGSTDIPWSPLNASAALSLVFNFLVNFGIAYTYPLFISVSMMLGIPLNAGVDVIIKHVTFSVLRLVSALLIVIGFILMLFPESWNDPIHSVILCKRRQREGESSGDGSNETLSVNKEEPDLVPDGVDMQRSN